MTYPPQHGAPGWPGDPNQGQQPGPYGGGIPTGQTQPDPYAPQPGPYNAPASGGPAGPYSPPGFQQPGYDQGFQQPGYPGGYPPGGPGMPPPAPKSNGSGWIIGAGVGVIVLVLIGTLTLFLTGVIGGGDDSGTVAADSTQGSDPADGDDAAEESASDRDHGTWQYIDGFCEDLPIDDFTGGMTEGSPVADFSLDFGDGQGSMSCIYDYQSADHSSYLVLSVTAKVESDAAAAATAYNDSVELSFQENPTESELPGSWDQAIVLTGGGIATTTVNSFAQIGNIAMQVSVGGDGLPYSESEIPDMAVGLMEEILNMSAA